MSLNLYITDFSNAAFEDDWRAEVASILRKAAGMIESGEDYFGLYDANGNYVGQCEIESPEPDLKTYLVTYYEAEDVWMDNPLIFRCEAEDEDHAADQCEDSNPGCTTTHIEEAED